MSSRSQRPSSVTGAPVLAFGAPCRRPLFQPSDDVEACSTGSWHEARVDSRVSNGQYLVVYKSLVDAANPSKPLREIARAFQVRRRPPIPNPNMPTPPVFHPGDDVEVKTRSKCFVGGWYEARVVSCSPSDQYFVVHKSLTDGNSQSLRETVPTWDLCPHPPPRSCDKLVIQEPVDVFYRDGWWSGWVSKISEEGSHYLGERILHLQAKDQHPQAKDQQYGMPQGRKDFRALVWLFTVEQIAVSLCMMLM